MATELFFWEDVTTYKDAESYKMKVSEIPQGSFEEVMIEQNYYLAKTATKKSIKKLTLEFLFFSIASYISVVVFFYPECIEMIKN